MRNSSKSALVALIIPFVLPACSVFERPRYVEPIDPSNVLLRETEPTVYNVIKVTPEEWQMLSKETREAIFDHNCTFAKRNPDAVPGFDSRDCDRPVNGLGAASQN
jgi:hypothetical protein